MSSLNGTQTEKNLLKAFAGESQARNRYTYAAGQAEKDGYRQIAAIFMETAEQERIHAKNFFKCLEGGAVEITAAYPAGTIGSTLENLKHAAGGEYEEWTELYPHFASVARDEGFENVAQLFERVCVAEKVHEERYNKLIALIEGGTTFSRSENVVWRCRKCGWANEGAAAPGKCPCCNHPQAYFEVLGVHY